MAVPSIPFSRKTRNHGLTADELSQLARTARYLPGNWRLDLAEDSGGPAASRVWLRRHSDDRMTAPDIGFERVAGLVWVTTKHGDIRSGVSFATVDGAISLLSQIMENGIGDQVVMR